MFAMTEATAAGWAILLIFNAPVIYLAFILTVLALASIVRVVFGPRRLTSPTQV